MINPHTNLHVTKKIRMEQKGTTLFLTGSNALNDPKYQLRVTKYNAQFYSTFKQNFLLKFKKKLEK